MKLLPIALVLALAATSVAQSSAPTPPAATNPSTLPAPTLEAYVQQLRTRYNIPERPGRGGRGGRGAMGGGMGVMPGIGGGGFGGPMNGTPTPEELIRAVQNASWYRVPLDVIENVGDARPRFLNDAQAAIEKFRDSVGDLDDETVRAKTASLKDQKAAVQLGLEVKQVKEKSIQDRIAGITRDVALKTDTDDILKALQKLETLRRQRLNDVQAQVNSGVGPPRALDAAESDLAAATIEVAKRRAEIASTAFGGALDTLNRALIEVSLDVEEQQATIKAIDSRLDKLQRTDESLSKMHALQSQVQSLTQLQAIEGSLQPTTQP
jgi:hypothetical protein